MSKLPLPADAVQFSRAYAAASPYLNKTAREHINGLCDVIEAMMAREALAQQPAQGDKVPGYFQTGVLTTPAKPAQGEAVCSGCNGRGEVGGWAGDSYQTDPCPFCAAPPEPKP